MAGIVTVTREAVNYFQKMFFFRFSIYFFYLFTLYLQLTKNSENSVYSKISIATYDASSSQLPTIKSFNEKSTYIYIYIY